MWVYIHSVNRMPPAEKGKSLNGPFRKKNGLAMKKIYDCFVKAEEAIACLLLAGIVALMFLSAVLRKAGMPINWAGDTSLLTTP